MKMERFRPKQSINRGEVAVIIDRAFEIEGTPNTLFNDVGKEKYYYKSIHDLKAAGLIKGYPNGAFEPLERNYTCRIFSDSV